jgi:hypothetical protein
VHYVHAQQAHQQHQSALAVLLLLCGWALLPLSALYQGSLMCRQHCCAWCFHHHHQQQQQLAVRPVAAAAATLPGLVLQTGQDWHQGWNRRSAVN